jgi:hypothetical protein
VVRERAAKVITSLRSAPSLRSAESEGPREGARYALRRYVSLDRARPRIRTVHTAMWPRLVKLPVRSTVQHQVSTRLQSSNGHALSG